MRSLPLESKLWKPLLENPLPYAGLATSLLEELDYAPEVEGKLPPGLEGTLYRNGPGRFDRGGMRKRMLLDGDGMIQALRIGPDGVHYRNRYVLTTKYLQESKAENFLYPTWSTQAPNRFWVNLGGRLGNQAGVTVGCWGDKLFAFDEGQRPYGLTPQGLETLGEEILDPQFSEATYLAHWKMDFVQKEFIHLTLIYGREMKARVTVLNLQGKVKRRHEFSLPRAVYLHDWLVSDTHFVFVLHPAVVSLSGYLSVILGRRAYADIVKWHPEQGNLIALVSRDSVPSNPELRCFPAEAVWMWHGLNAFERDGELVMDFVGSKSDGGLGREDSPLFELMRGQAPKLDPVPFTQIKRYRIDLVSGSLREETLAEKMTYEMPYVNPKLACHAHRYGYFAASHPGELFWSAVLRLDTKTGHTDTFDFGPGVYCSEPVFAGKSGTELSGDGPEPGWILTQGYDDASKRSFVAILDAENISAGPVARILLSHHVPLSFHGQWVSGF